MQQYLQLTQKISDSIIQKVCNEAFAIGTNSRLFTNTVKNKKDIEKRMKQKMFVDSLHDRRVTYSQPKMPILSFSPPRESVNEQKGLRLKARFFLQKMKTQKDQLDTKIIEAQQACIDRRNREYEQKERKRLQLISQKKQNLYQKIQANKIKRKIYLADQQYMLSLSKSKIDKDIQCDQNHSIKLPQIRITNQLRKVSELNKIKKFEASIKIRAKTQSDIRQDIFQVQNQIKKYSNIKNQLIASSHRHNSHKKKLKQFMYMGKNTMGMILQFTTLTSRSQSLSLNLNNK